jgi:hypothetical protein
MDKVNRSMSMMDCVVGISLPGVREVIGGAVPCGLAPRQPELAGHSNPDAGHQEGRAEGQSRARAGAYPCLYQLQFPCLINVIYANNQRKAGPCAAQAGRI